MKPSNSFIAVLLMLAGSTFTHAQDNLTDAQKAAMEAVNAINKAPKEITPKESGSKYWKNSLMTKLDFGQTSLTNWAAGGYNTVSLKSFIDGNANYQKEAMFWNNRLQLDYGFIYSEDKPFLQKTDDRIYLESKWGYSAVKNLYMSAQYSFKSQFSNSWKYDVTPTAPADAPDDWEPSKKDWMAVRTLNSGLLSPAYTNLALGIDYTPTKWLTANFAPLTGGFVIVHNPLLRETYKMELKKRYENNEEQAKAEIAELKAQNMKKEAGEYYRGSRFEFGAQLKVDIKVNVNDNFNYTTQVVLFSDYLNNPQNIRVNWDNRFDWKLAKYFALTVTTNLIYDDNVLIKNEKDLDAYLNGKQRVQFKESLSFGFTYTFATKNG